MRHLILFHVLCLSFFGCSTPLQFVPNQLPEGKLGQAYNAEILIQQEKTPVGEISIKTGQLPKGLNFSYHKEKRENFAVIQGTPEERGTFPITLNAWCYGTNFAGQQGEQSYELLIK